MNKAIAFLLTRMMNVYVLSLGILAFGWGLILCLPAGGPTTGQVGAFMTYLAPEPIWGAVSMGAGTLMGYGAIKGDPCTTKLGLFLGFLVWAFVFMTNVIGLPLGTGVMSSSFLAWAHVLAHLVVSSRPEVLKHRL